MRGAFGSGVRRSSWRGEGCIGARAAVNMRLPHRDEPLMRQRVPNQDIQGRGSPPARHTSQASAVGPARADPTVGPVPTNSAKARLLKRLIVDIHRRSLWQVLTIYAVGSWGALQIVDALTESAGLPVWVPGFALVLLIIGLPIVLATAFVQEGLPGSAAAPAQPKQEAPAASNLAGGTGSLDRPSTRPRPHQRLFTWRNAILGGVGAFALLGFAAAAYLGMRTLGIGSPGTLLAQGVIDAGATVLLADFESAGDPELGAVVTKALRIDLLQSPTIRLFERADVGDALSRMHVDPGAPITAGVGTQLAEREGFAAVIAGDVATAGTGYVLTASILAGEGYRPLAAFRETARNDGELVDAIERLSRSIRDKVGESLRSVHSGPALAQVTTSSLPALRAYTRGLELESAGDNGAALQQYERAIALDSTFAMAYRKVSGTLLNQNIRLADARRAARKAWELRDRLPPLERNLAVGFYHNQVSGDVDAAVRAYEQALAIDSTDASVRNSLANVYRLQQRHTEAEQLYAAPLREGPYAALWLNLGLTRCHMGDVAGAMATLDSARAVLPALTLGFHVQAACLESAGNYAGADSLVGLLESGARTPRDRAFARLHRFVLALVRGRLREADQIVTAPGAELFMADPLRVANDRARIALQRADTTVAVRIVQEALARGGDSDFAQHVPNLISVLTAAGAAAPAADLLTTWQAAAPAEELGIQGRIDRDLAVAQVARVHGDLEASAELLESLRARCPGCGAYITYEYARIRDEMGDAEGAIAEYGRSLEQPDPVRLLNEVDVPHALRRLAELYDARGDTEQAARYYARFIDLWSKADPELQPQVRAARARLERLTTAR
jgi:tetratricopeptide (TPR) repeat protein